MSDIPLLVFWGRFPFGDARPATEALTLVGLLKDPSRDIENAVAILAEAMPFVARYAATMDDVQRIPRVPDEMRQLEAEHVRGRRPAGNIFAPHGPRTEESSLGRVVPEITKDVRAAHDEPRRLRGSIDDVTCARWQGALRTIVAGLVVAGFARVG